MKKIFFTVTALSILGLVSCKKNDKNLSNGNKDVAGRISLVTDNMQTKYGTFTSSASIQGSFNSALKIASLVVGGYNVEKTSTGMFYGQTSSSPELQSKFGSFYGSPADIALNGQKISNLPAVPYSNSIKIEGDLINWTISKSKGLTISWKIKPPASTVGTTGTGSDSGNLPAQVDGSKTVVAIIPDDLQHTNGTSQYWVVDNNTQSFTISSDKLSKYGTGETLTLTVSSGTDYVTNNDVDILSISNTSLPGIQVTQ